MGKDRDIHKKIKDSFEKKQSAPDLWGDISSKLSSSSESIDEKVKESFNHNKYKVPEKVWSGVNKQLTIDKGWRKVQLYLKRATLFRKLQTAAVFIFLLFLFWTKVPLPETHKTIITDSKLEELLKLKYSQQLLPSLNDTESDDHLIQNKNDVNSDNDSEITEQALSNKKNNSLINPKHSKKQNYLAPQKNIQVPHDLKYLVASSHTSVKKNHISDTSMKYIPINHSFNFERNYIKELVIAKEYIKLPEPSHSDRKTFEVGVFGAMNESVLINNELRVALDPKSLVAFKPELGSQFGAVFVCRFNRKFSFQNMFVHAHFQQAFEKFETGKLITEKADFRFLRVQSLGQFNHQLKNPNLSVAFKLGPYLSYLYRYKLFVNEEPVSNTENMMNRIDVGLTTHVGMEQNIKNKWVLDYGVNISKGMINLNTSTLKKPASFDPTRSFELGFYMSFRYKF